MLQNWMVNGTLMPQDNPQEQYILIQHDVLSSLKNRVPSESTSRAGFGKHKQGIISE